MAKFIGTPGNDSITGTESRDFISSLQGDDTIEALGGNDRIGANDGDDVVFAGEGNDRILAGRGNDDIRSGEGNDLVFGRGGDDLIFGGGSTDAEDDDTLYGNQGDDRIAGQNGNDKIFGGIGEDDLGGDAGDDYLNGNSGNDYLNGGSGNDYLIGGPGDDLLLGNGGVQGVPSIAFPSNDTLIGGAGNDTLDGVLDTITGNSSGKDEIDILTGGGKKDTFVLGSNKVYYDDEDPNTEGLNDYALITDFHKNTDIIQLKGTSDDYMLDPTFGIDDRHGTAIFLKDDVNELIGLAEGVFDLDLNSDDFSYEEPLATIGLNFTGSTVFESGFNPPDTMGAVGSDHIVELINGRYKVYDKDTGAVEETSSLNQFWEDAGVSLGNFFAFDPRVLYDPLSERWFAVSGDDLGNDPANSNFLVAVSNDSDPTLGWSGFEIETVGFTDFPTLGFNSEGIFTASGPALATLVLPKTDLINGTLFEQNPNLGGTFQPVVDLDNTGQPHSLYKVDSDSSFKRVIVSDPIDSPMLDTEGGLVSVNPFDNVIGVGGAKQPDTNKTLDIVDSRFKTNLVLQNGAIWGVQDVNNNGRAAIRWFQIDADTNELLQEGLIADSELDLYYGSIAVNDYDDVVIGLNGSGETQFVSSLAVVGDTFGGDTIFSEPILLEESTVSYEIGSQGFAGPDSLRWGDYSATVVDPDDPFTFWTFQTLAFADNAWSTQITEITLESDFSEETGFQTTSDLDRTPDHQAFDNSDTNSRQSDNSNTNMQPNLQPNQSFEVIEFAEAEDMTLDAYLVEDNNFASGDKLIGLEEDSVDKGTALTQFKGPSGSYDILIGYFDENDGEGQLELQVNGVSVDNWVLDQDLGASVANAQTFTERAISGVELESQDTLTILGTRESGESARVDFLSVVTPTVMDTDLEFTTDAFIPVVNDI